jgi:hypothetical protein
MKKKILTSDEFNQVLKLKQAGDSWLKIERATGIPRRTAQRAYEDWQRSQSMIELIESRKAVAAEAFREHVASLISLGTFLAMNLEIPRSISAEAPSGEQMVDSLWQREVLNEILDFPLGQLSGVDAEKQKRLVTHQQQMLFQSLQDHTRGEVRWELLEQWEKAWDESKQFYIALQKEGTEVIRNFLRQENGLENKIKNGNREGDAITQMVEKLLGAIWIRILDDKLDSQQDIFEVKAGHHDVAYVSEVGIGNSVFLSFNDKNIAQNAARLGNKVARNLLMGESKDIIEKYLKGRVIAMKRVTEELAEMLNPLVLRPIIFRTRCKLCPA